MSGRPPLPLFDVLSSQEYPPCTSAPVSFAFRFGGRIFRIFRPPTRGPPSLIMCFLARKVSTLRRCPIRCSFLVPHPTTLTEAAFFFLDFLFILLFFFLPNFIRVLFPLSMAPYSPSGTFLCKVLLSRNFGGRLREPYTGSLIIKSQQAQIILPPFPPKCLRRKVFPLSRSLIPLLEVGKTRFSSFPSVIPSAKHCVSPLLLPLAVAGFWISARI